MPAVSVVVASYNHSRYLDQCISSVLEQTFEDFELLIVDDRSPDNSVEIARAYTDPRVRVFVNEENIGTYATENAGLDLATGGFVAILNSDDYWHPSKLQKQMQGLLKHPDASFSYTLGDVVDDSGAVIPSFDQHADWPREELQDPLPFLLDVNQILASSVVFRRGLTRFKTKLRYCGDWVAALQLALQGPAVFIDEPLSFWRQHDSNSSKLLGKTIGEEIRVRTDVLGAASALLAKCDEKLGREHLGRCALALAAHQILLGNKADARATLKEGMKLAGETPALKKRLLSTYLPLPILRKHLWPDVDPEEIARSYRVVLDLDIFGLV